MYKIDLEKHPRVKKLLQAQVGDKTDLSQFSVFELRANDTLPITRAGGMLLNARMTQTYLSQMAQKVVEGQYVPVIQLHQQHNTLPVGRVLDAKVYDNTTDFNQKDLHLLIYLQADNPDAQKIDAGIINEVSTGTSPSTVRCSACDFDFYANDDNKRKLWAGKDYTPLCDKGHQWGMNGNHLRLDGMKEFREISVVTRGAVPTAQVIKAENYRLAAESSEINLSAKFNADILLSTTAGANFNGFEKPADLVIEHNDPNKGDEMGTVNLEQDKYDQLIKDQGKLDHLNTELAAEKKTAADALTAKTQAEADKAQAEADKAKAEADLAAEKTKYTELEAQLTAANAKLAVYAAGGKPDGEGSGQGAGGNDAADANLQQPVFDTSFYKAK